MGSHYIMRSKEPLISVEPHEWVSYFQGLCSVNNDRLLLGLYETQTLGPSYIAEYKQ
jgi:hypothetical protein